ncbi:hypothetical protein [Agrobacterium rosae]|uniref:hypothetical protein n=1 Tax=Agrobacterium rosae TaxID=1972867 RepID=UPI002033B31F|nr:hypothetical protein [Agrobacterium rosae]MCM2433208.1 hypothetical protein [Agrobacterium rosae]
MIDWIVSAFVVFTAFLALHGFQTSHLVAGFFGGIMRAVISSKGTISERIASGFVGTIFAMYFTPLAVWLLSITDPQSANSLAFAIGMLGLYVAEACIGIAKQWAGNPGKFRRDISDLVIRIFSKRD